MKKMLLIVMLIAAFPALIFSEEKKPEAGEKSRNCCKIKECIKGTVGIDHLEEQSVTAQDIIRKLDLEPMPENKDLYFREIYRSKFSAKTEKPRSCATMIYDLMQGDAIDPWHKISSDEIFIHHAGTPVSMMLLYEDGAWEEKILGSNVTKGEVPQVIVPAGTWMAIALKDRSPESWALMGVLVVPGFEYEDIIKGDAEELIKEYPAAAGRIRELGID